MAVRGSAHGAAAVNALLEFANRQNARHDHDLAAAVGVQELPNMGESVWARISRDRPHDVRSLIRFPVGVFLNLCVLLEPLLCHSGTSGRQSDMAPREQLFLTFYFLARYPTLSALSLMYNRRVGVLYGIISRTVCLIAPVLVEKFVKFHPPSVQIQHGWQLQAYPEVVGIGDATLIPIKKPHGSRHLYYSGKHKQIGVKLQCITSCNGLVMDHVSMIPGSEHDFKIFRENQTYRVGQK